MAEETPEARSAMDGRYMLADARSALPRAL
jgi:hypothetical protein